MLIALSLALIVVGQLVLLLPWFGNGASGLFVFNSLNFLPNGVPRAQALSVGLLFLIAGSLLLAFLAFFRARATIGASTPGVSQGRWSLRGLPIRYPVLLGCLMGMAVLHLGSVLHSIRENQELSNIFGRWLLSLGAAGFCLGAWDRWLGRSLRNPLTAKEWIGCTVLTAAALTLYTFDVDSYLFGFVGDEFTFFSVARDLLNGRIGWGNVFSEEGIWGYHPRLSSFYQAFIMSIFGVDNFGWKLSSALAAAACLLPCFIFLKHSISARAAWFGVLFLGLSHYSITFAHIGYNNNHVLFPTILCLAFLFWAAWSGSGLGYFLSGVSAGLGFYTFYTSRLALVFAAMFFALKLLRAPRRPWLPYIGCFLLGLTLTLGPSLALPERFIENMRQQSVFAADEGQAATDSSCWLCLSPAQEAKIKRNTSITVLSPVYFEAGSHFVSGTLVDAVTASFFVIGLCAAMLSMFRATVYPFLLGVYLIPALVLGITTPYDTPPVSRMLFMVLPTVLLAALGVECVLGLGSRLGARWQRPGIVAMGLLMAFMGFLNLHRVYVESPRDNGIQSQALVLKYLQEAPETGRYYYLLPDEWGAELIVLHFEIYKLDHKVKVMHFSDLRKAPEQLQSPCEVLFNQEFTQQRQELIEWIQAQHPGGSVNRYLDPGGRNEMSVLRLP